jgi:hypothetical protein
MASRRAQQNWNVMTNGREANSRRREQERLGYTALETSKTVKIVTPLCAPLAQRVE